MNNFYVVHCDHWEDYGRNRTVYCKTREKAVELAIDFLLNDNNTYDTMLYTLLSAILNSPILMWMSFCQMM